MGGVVPGQGRLGRFVAGHRDVALVPGIDPLLRIREPVPATAVDLDRPDALGRPVGEVPDVVPKRPARGELGLVPARQGHPPDERIELRADRPVLGQEARNVRSAGVGHERVAVRLARPQVRCPWFDDDEVVEVVPVEGLVDPAPRRVGADVFGREPVRQGEQARPGRREALEDDRARHGRPRRPAALVEAVEVAAVVVIVARPPTGLERDRDVIDGELLPVRHVTHMLGQRPVRAAGVRWRGARQVPGGVVEPGPGPLGTRPQVGLVGPQVTVGLAEVDLAQRRQGRRTQVRAGMGGRRRHAGSAPPSSRGSAPRRPCEGAADVPTLASS